MEIEKTNEGQADCCSPGACCCSTAPTGKGRTVRTIVFLIVIVAAVAIATLALANRYGWLASKTDAPVVEPVKTPAPSEPAVSSGGVAGSETAPEQPRSPSEPCCAAAAKAAPKPCCGEGTPEPASCGCAGGN